MAHQLGARSLLAQVELTTAAAAGRRQWLRRYPVVHGERRSAAGAAIARVCGHATLASYCVAPWAVHMARMEPVEQLLPRLIEQQRMYSRLHRVHRVDVRPLDHERPQAAVAVRLDVAAARRQGSDKAEPV